MFCSICGKKNSENTAFCPNCGNPMHRPAPFTQPQDVPAAPAAPVSPSGELPGKTMGIVGMILGIISILFGCCTPIFPMICAIVGLVLSCISRKKASGVLRKNNFSLAGLICSIIGLVFSVIYSIIFIILLLAEYV